MHVICQARLVLIKFNVEIAYGLTVLKKIFFFNNIIILNIRTTCWVCMDSENVTIIIVSR